MALRVQRGIVSRLHTSQFFTIMVDECTDVTNKEQVGFSYMFMWYAQSMYMFGLCATKCGGSFRPLNLLIAIIHLAHAIGYSCSPVGR